MSLKSKYIEELKKYDTSARMIEDNKELNYVIRILNRGEELFYFDKNKDKALIIDIQVRNGAIFSKSISKWSDGEEISEEIKNNIVKRLINYFLIYQKIKAFVK